MQATIVLTNARIGIKMSEMKDVAYDIEQLWIDGFNAGQIARQLKLPDSLVLDWIADQGLRPFDQWPNKAQQKLIQDLELDN